MRNGSFLSSSDGIRPSSRQGVLDSASMSLNDDRIDPCRRQPVPTLLIDVALPADRLKAVYQGHANRIQLRSRDGRSVNLPAHHLKPFVTENGVYGSFQLHFSDEGKFISLTRVTGT